MVVLPSMRVPRTMPPKSKRKLQLQESLEKAREVKMKRSSGEGTSSSAETEVVWYRFTTSELQNLIMEVQALLC